ncbi:hypothetical protein NCC49_006355 [Naganishia albida]|nr:hypothetical protein NCC49_006355 [Naganishia albida]
MFAIKRALRKATQQRIATLSRDEVERQSGQILEHLKNEGILDGKKAVGCYLSMQDGEVGTEGIVDELLRSGTPIYVPIIPPPPPDLAKHAPPPSTHDMRMLRLYSAADYAHLPRDRWGIPDAGAARADVEGEKREDCMSPDAPIMDVILVPGVCFDSKFQRLGHGKGYYDRFIKRYRAFAEERGQQPPLLVALALSEQMLPFPPSEQGKSDPQTEQEKLRAAARALQEVPVNEDDELVDWVVTPEGVRKRR